jgi:hypothetical protein
MNQMMIYYISPWILELQMELLQLGQTWLHRCANRSKTYVPNTEHDSLPQKCVCFYGESISCKFIIYGLMKIE